MDTNSPERISHVLIIFLRFTLRVFERLLEALNVTLQQLFFELGTEFRSQKVRIVLRKQHLASFVRFIGEETFAPFLYQGNHENREDNCHATHDTQGRVEYGDRAATAGSKEQQTATDVHAIA